MSSGKEVGARPSWLDKIGVAYFRELVRGPATLAERLINTLLHLARSVHKATDERFGLGILVSVTEDVSIVGVESVKDVQILQEGAMQFRH